MDDIKQITAKNISSLRIGKKMTQLELAEMLNYSDKAVSKWERGESLPDVVTLKNIADIFSVTVDYLITEHSEKEKPPVSKTVRNNHIFITLIAMVGVWFIGTCIFALSGLFEHKLWFSFVVCVPFSMVVLLIFNSIWGSKRVNMYVISALLWSTLFTIYLGFYIYGLLNLWLIFIIGIPTQIIIFLCFRIKGVKRMHLSLKKHKAVPKDSDIEENNSTLNESEREEK